MLWKHTIRMCLAALAIIGCAKEPSTMVEQSGIFTTYRTSYDDTDRSLNAQAIFNFGGSTGTYLELSNGSNVQWDGEVLQKSINIANQVLYKFSKNGLAVDQVWKPHAFTYRNNDGKAFENAVEIPELLAIEYSASQISIAGSLVVNWSTDTAVGNDNIYLSMHTIKGDGSSRIEEKPAQGSVGNVTSGTITVNSGELTTWGLGQLDVQLCRERISVPQAPDAGGYLASSSCTAKTTITVVK